MEQEPANVESSSFLEVTYGGETTRRSVLQKLLDKRPINFLCTKNGDLFLSDAGHEYIRTKNGLDFDDVATRGFVKMDVSLGTIGMDFEENVSDILKKSIRRVLSDLLGELKQY